MLSRRGGAQDGGAWLRQVGVDVVAREDGARSSAGARRLWARYGGAWLARGPGAVAWRGWVRGGSGATMRLLGLGHDGRQRTCVRLSNPPKRDSKGNGEKSP